MIGVLLGLVIEVFILVLPIQGSSVSAEPKLDLPYTTSRAMELLYGSYEPGSLSWTPRGQRPFRHPGQTW
jgi:hypothetical protein